MKFNFPIYSIAFLMLLISACSGKVSLNHFVTSPTPYERYVSALNETALQNTVLGKSWLVAGQQSLADSLFVELPHAEKGYFTAEQPTAVSFRYSVRQGQAVHIQLLTESSDSIKLFLDVFSIEQGKLSSIITTDTGRNISYEASKDEVHLLRLQPELLVSSGYNLQIEQRPTLGFPVSGKNYRAVGSFFGDPRDGGQRSHRGIDIFAPKGTPVVAAHSGMVSPSTQNRLGGKVVWLSSLKKKFNQYYAHLDSQVVRPGQRVNRGDTIGFVGNTGNARFTPPHLHFSIYSLGRGAVDPYPFVADNPGTLDELTVDSSLVGTQARIQTTLANIRQSPSVKAAIITTAPKHSLVSIGGASGSWYRIQLPDGTRGFAHRSLIQSLEKPLKTLIITESHQPYVRLHPEQPVAQLWEGQQVEVLASSQSHWYVETANGTRLWMQEAA